MPAVLLAAVVLAGAPAPAQIERGAFTFARYSLDVQVTPATQELAAKGTVTLRNDSPAPQRRAVLQISSTLGWKAITAAGKPVLYVSQPYTTDIDHTGEVTEAIVTLPAPVAAGATVELQVEYGGTIAQDATRLTRIGVPEAAARRNEWDQISSGFTGVRGAGHVAWYPVSIEAVSLGSGAEVFEAVGEWRQREASATMRLHLCVNTTWPTGAQPSKAPMILSNGTLRPEAGGSVSGAEGAPTIQGASCRSFDFAPLGMTVPVIAAGPFTQAGDARQAAIAFHLPGHEAQAREYALVGTEVEPLIREWFGSVKRPVEIIELPAADAAPWESGSMLFTPLRTMERKTLQVILAHQAAHAALDSPRPWIAEGLATFAQALERERQDGRAAALGFMQDQVRPLVELAKEGALRAPAQPKAAVPHQPAPAGPGQSLVTATDEVLYRTKAMFCWWMLRDMIGDAALQKVIARYRPAEDTEPSYVQRLAEAEAKKPLEWFFDDWVYRDKGLPDLRIEAAFPRATIAGAYGVTVTVENLGEAAVEVPVAVRVEGGERAGRVLVPGKQKGVVRVLVPATPVEAVVNDGSVPESDMRNNRFKIPGTQAPPL